jgi:hypothetical protein
MGKRLPSRWRVPQRSAIKLSMKNARDGCCAAEAVPPPTRAASNRILQEVAPQQLARS